MKTYDNGTIAVTLDNDHTTVRLVDHVPRDESPPFVGIGQITRLNQHVVFLHGFCGKVSAPHFWLVLNALHQEGFTVAYIVRRDGHAMPCAELIEEGDFAGMWRLPLEAVRDRRKSRKPKPE